MKQFNRNSAFKMNLAETTKEDIGGVQIMMNLDDKLICFSDNRITEIIPAEITDPNNEQPETRHSYQYIYDIGTANSFVACTIIQSKELLDSVILRKELDKQVILDHVWKSTKLLIKCENSHHGIFSQVTELMKECDAIVNEHKKKSFIPTLPQVNNLDQYVESFLGNAKRFLECTYELLSMFCGSPNFESDFNAYRNWMIKNKPDYKKIIDMLEKDKDWVQFLSWSRNALDINHSRTGFKVTIENFKMQKGNKFSSPSWRYDFTAKKGKLQKEPSDIIVDMDVYMHNMTAFFEDLLILSIQENWANSYNYKIYRKNDNEINEKCPTVYFVSNTLQGECENT